MIEEMEVSSAQTVALGCNQTRFALPEESYVDILCDFSSLMLCLYQRFYLDCYFLVRFTCILCQEEQTVGVIETKLVMAAFVQRSTVMSQDPQRIGSESDINSLRDRHRELDYLFQSPEFLVSPHVSSCGHIMHNTCWATHMEGVISKERRRPYRCVYRFTRRSTFIVYHFYCPLYQFIA